MAEPILTVEHLVKGYGENTVLDDVSFSVRPGEVVVVVGPSGCGKSTLLRAVLGMAQRMGGQVLFDGRPVEELSAREIAQRAAYMPQDRPVPSISVRRMALHGRFPYLSYPRHYRREDYDIVDAALRRADALAVAMDARCYHGGPGRTRLKPLHYSALDRNAVIVLAAMFAVVFSTNFIPL